MKQLLLSIFFGVCVSGQCKIFKCHETEYNFITGWWQVCKQDGKPTIECNKAFWENANAMCTENTEDRFFRLKK